MNAKEFLKKLKTDIEQGNLPKVNFEWLNNLEDSSLLNIALMERDKQGTDTLLGDLLLALVRRIESKMGSSKDDTLES